MGEVFKAWDPRLERDVAIKLLHPEMAGDPDRQRRLVAEGRAASALNHPNIVRVYDADVDGTSYYLVSEWLEGKSLRDELSRGAAAAEAAARSGGADRRRPVGRARDGHRASRHQAREHHAGARWHGAHRRFRPRAIRSACAGDGRGDRRSRDHDGVARGRPQRHAGLHESRTGARHGRRFPHRSVFLRRAAVRDGDGGVTPFAATPWPTRWRRCCTTSRGRSPSSIRAFPRRAAGSSSSASPRTPASVMRPPKIWRGNCGAFASGSLRRWRTEAAPASGRRSRAMAVIAAAAVAARRRCAALLAIAGAEPRAGAALRRHSRRRRSTKASPRGRRTGRASRTSRTSTASCRCSSSASAMRSAGRSTRGRFDAERAVLGAERSSGCTSSLCRRPRGACGPWAWPAARPELVLENVSHAAIDPDGARLALLRVDPDDASGRTALVVVAAGCAARSGAPDRSTPGNAARPNWPSRRRPAAGLESGVDGIDTPTIACNREVSMSCPRAGRRHDSVLTALPRTTAFRRSPGWLTTATSSSRLPDASGGNRHLWIADTEADASRQITATHTNETTPAASPDGRPDRVRIRRSRLRSRA